MLGLERVFATARHRRECYRWQADGRCIDCGLYTGFPDDVIQGVAVGAIVYYRPGTAPKAETAVRSSRKPSTPRLTADQLATQRAWREWRAAQGDSQPDVPRRKRQPQGRSRSPA